MIARLYIGEAAQSSDRAKELLTSTENLAAWDKPPEVSPTGRDKSGGRSGQLKTRTKDQHKPSSTSNDRLAATTLVSPARTPRLSKQQLLQQKSAARRRARQAVEKSALRAPVAEPVRNAFAVPQNLGDAQSESEVDARAEICTNGSPAVESEDQSGRHNDNVQIQESEGTLSNSKLDRVQQVGGEEAVSNQPIEPNNTQTPRDPRDSVQEGHRPGQNGAETQEHDNEASSEVDGPQSALQSEAVTAAQQSTIGVSTDSDNADPAVVSTENLEPGAPLLSSWQETS
eukprot:INCI7260.1.p1 GENE.INCI7260.1~~INCI7260.1.p1  ORF type:complete len:286 (-),score=43.09 INCI7260.1:2141-2998(-)